MEARAGQKEITGRERVYNFLVKYIGKNGYAPTIREICIGTGLSSTATVHNHLVTLSLMKMIEIKPYASRAIRLLE